MKTLLIIVAILVVITGVLVIVTYPRYSREMRAARNHLQSESEILNTDKGEIEYAVKGEGTPVLVLHGAGEREEVPTNHLSAPTLIIHAEDDALVSYHHAEDAHKKIKQSRLIFLSTGGHAMLSQMDEVRQYVKEFLKNIRSDEGDEK
jgi:fermentation-respiration switch protein FrsA (DUF1100 family)